FASEIRAILASGLLGKPRLNPHTPACIAWNGFMVSPETAIVGIDAMWPGQFRVFDLLGKEQVSERYWTVAPLGGRGPPVGEAELAEILEESVRLHLASVVPLGLFLSGGVDSAAVANLAHKASREPVHTFTLAFEEQEYNESVIARRVASAIGTRHTEVVLTEEHFISQLDSALDSLDQPTFDGLNSYYMSQAVQQAGFKVALVGTGGDELFGGYTSFHDLPALLWWSKVASWLPREVVRPLAKLVSSVLQPTHGTVPPQTRWAKLQEAARCDGDLLALYQLAYALFLPNFQRQLLSEGLANISPSGLPAAMSLRLLDETRSRSSLSAISILEQRLYL